MLASKIRSATLLVRSILAFSLMKPVAIHECKGVLVGGAFAADIVPAGKVYAELNNKNFSFPQKIIIRFFSRKMLIVAKAYGDVVGVNLYYFNGRDFREKTIHEGFLGVLPRYQGKGIGGMMKKVAIKHFSTTGLEGVSSRISKNNSPSMAAAKKLGFNVVETYFDKNFNEERHYLIRNIRK